MCMCAQVRVQCVGGLGCSIKIAGDSASFPRLSGLHQCTPTTYTRVAVCVKDSTCPASPTEGWQPGKHTDTVGSSNTTPSATPGAAPEENTKESMNLPPSSHNETAMNTEQHLAVNTSWLCQFVANQQNTQQQNWYLKRKQIWKSNSFNFSLKWQGNCTLDLHCSITLLSMTVQPKRCNLQSTAMHVWRTAHAN